MSHSVWPQVNDNHLSPFLHGVQHGGSCSFLQVPYTVLRYAILKVSVHAAVQEALPTCLAILYERVVCEMPIVSVVVFDLYPTLLGGSFERMLGHDCFLAGYSFLQVDESVSRKLVDEDGGILVPLLREGSLELCNETR